MGSILRSVKHIIYNKCIVYITKNEIAAAIIVAMRKIKRCSETLNKILVQFLLKKRETGLENNFRNSYKKLNTGTGSNIFK